ncbi:hypothetical protein ASPWEDRAFT_171865 [Aspergillus wentii DTO 134E9]|uniref:LDB19 N-terminal domain-containing protein n=1 Tax=Aspergillus wentii DTO 134E9 TaxID=1073089 RepID=A0A1L9RJB5_ASPWE|nr:uncharacterized protein ASPWEDRAFT_171865 [Aspergillus wentii DTO 134E9]KAI9932007.1 hypothetical protein MW887_009510 [Aspergillus wentii]OJJ35036.1 hypothetical protein ASPWEDRAFT_171865 [Aspergillus wentii DTO 134E9]
MHLNCPYAHSVYVQPDGRTYSPPLLGSLSFEDNVQIQSLINPQIDICLVRMVKWKAVSSETHTGKNPFARLSLRRSPSRAEHTLVLSSVEELARCTITIPPLPTTQGHLEFSMSIPSNTPPTTNTPIATISYAIVATVNRPPETPIVTTHPMQLVRYTVQNEPQSIQYIRTYPNSRTRTTAILPQNATTDSRPTISFSVTILLRPAIAPGDRKTEMKHIVVKDVRWRVDEIAKLFDKPIEGQMQSICKDKHVRSLCSARQKGHWSIPKKQCLEQHKDTQISITFDIDISQAAMAADDTNISAFTCGHLYSRPLACDNVDQPSTSKAIAITVDHQLEIELLADEDTFHIETGKLVDRRHWKAFSAQYPLSLCKYLVEEEVLPRYEGISNAPPEYAGQY